MNKKLEIIEHLEALGKSEILPLDVGCGLCTELSSKFSVKTSALKKYFMMWDKYSGDITYPIPPLQHESAEEQYVNTGNKWVDEQGKLRRSLCLHIAKKMRKQFRL